MDCHYYRLRAVLNVKEQRKQASARAACSDLAEFLDVRACDKSSAASDYHGCFDRRVAIHLIDRRSNSLGHAGTERVYRRIVDRDHRDILMFTDFHQIVHRASERSDIGTGWYFLRSSLFRTLPVAVLGKLSQNSIDCGHL